MRLTYDELTKLPMTYIFGVNGTDYCARKYINEEWNIAKEVITHRKTPGDIYSGFKKPKVSYYRGDGPIYNTSRELWEGEFLTPWFEGGRPARDGWYETDRGMLYFQTHVGQWFRDTADTFPVLAPKQWRGMQDIQPITKQDNA